MWFKLTEQLKSQIKLNNLILTNIDTALVYFDTEGRVVWENVSKKFSIEETGIELYHIGKQCFENHGEFKTPCNECLIFSTLHDHKSHSCVKKIKNGKELELTSMPSFDDNGEVSGVLFRINDVTESRKIDYELKRSKTEAKQSSQLLLKILDLIPTSLFVKDATDGFKYIIANRQFCKLQNVKEADIIGKTDYEILPHSESLRYNKVDEQAMASNEPVYTEDVTYNESGERHFYKTSKTRLIISEDRKLLICMSVDITDIRQANAALVKAKERAEQSDKLKSAFLANMSHEIRTPLNAIVGFSQLLQETTDKEELAQYIQIITANNELLLRLINDILYLSKIDSGVAQLHISETEFVDIFSDVVTIAAHRLENPAITIIKSRPYKSCICMVDRERISQIWLNFITNSVKYTQTGYIKIGFDYRNDGIYIYVEDTGIGIPAEKQNRVFHRFEKLDNFAQGNGLGLSICKAITDISKGKIGFTSEKGKGSKFWAWIPTVARITPIENVPQVSDEAEATAISDVNEEVSKSNDSNEYKGFNVLIAEDNDNNFTLIHAILDFCNVTRAKDGEEAVLLAKKNRYDVILMDIMMPVMDGLEATRKIREFNADIPIIAVTASTFDTDNARAIDAGCTDYLSKPVSNCSMQ